MARDAPSAVWMCGWKLARAATVSDWTVNEDLEEGGRVIAGRSRKKEERKKEEE